MHISFYAFLTHKSKFLLLCVNRVRKRNHNGTVHLSDKAQLSYKKHAMPFPLLHNTINKKTVSLVTLPSPILSTVSLKNLLVTVFSPVLWRITCSDFVLLS